MHMQRTPTAAVDARRAVLRRFGELLGEETLDDVLLVVSELVTNALLHGRGRIELRMALDSRHVTGAVTDEGRGFDERPQEYDPARIGGHGLHIVDRIAESWGTSDRSTNVWFQIPTWRA